MKSCICVFQLCLQLFQSFPELRRQGWFHLQQMVSKDAVTTGLDRPEDPVALIVRGILVSLTQKVGVSGKLFVMVLLMVVVVMICMLIL